MHSLEVLPSTYTILDGKEKVEEGAPPVLLLAGAEFRGEEENEESGGEDENFPHPVFPALVHNNFSAEELVAGQGADFSAREDVHQHFIDDLRELSEVTDEDPHFTSESSPAPRT